MTKETTILLLVRNGSVEGMSIEDNSDFILEWLDDDATEMIVRVPLELGRNMLFKSRAELFRALEEVPA